MLAARGIAATAVRAAPLRAFAARHCGAHGRGATAPSLAALLAARQSPAARAGSRRLLSSRTPDAPYEALKADFRRWLRGELVLLAAMLCVGAGGVYFYQNREGAPWKRVTRLLAQAGRSAEQGDKEQALRLTLQAYDVVLRTNPRDRHLFELAFAIAAQYETLKRGGPATKYYLDALDHLAHMGDSETGARGVKSRVVALDRVAQCYEDRGQAAAAERYFRQAIATYDQHIGQRALSSSQSTTAEAAERRQLEREIPGALYNYGSFLLGQARLEEAALVLRRASRLAKAARLEDRDVALIDEQLMRLDARLAEAEVESKSNATPRQGSAGETGRGSE